MENGDFIYQLGVMILAAAIALVAGRFAGLPGVVAYLAAGFIIGPVLDITSHSHQLDWLFETGIVLMLFLVGLEMSPELVKHLKGKPLITGICQVISITTFGTVFLLSLVIPLKAALVSGLALSLSSTIVVLKVLQDSKQTRSAHGQLALAILLTQDFVVILALTLLDSAGSIESPTLTTLLLPLLKTTGSFVLLFVICYGMMRFVLNPVFGWSKATPDVLMVVGLAWCFGVVTIAHKFHLSAESGGFMAGLLMARIPSSEDLRRRVHPLMQLFVAVFFVNLASRMEVASVASNLSTFIIIGLFVLIAKPLLMFGLFRLIGWRKRMAIRTALLLGQISEFSLILMAGANRNGIVDEAMSNIFLALALLSFPVNIIIYQLIYRNGGTAHEEPDEISATKEPPHTVVIGMNALGKLLVNKLIERGRNVVAVDTDPKKLRNLNCKIIIGSIDYQETLEDLHLRKASLVISALRIEEANELIAYWCKRNDVPCCIHGVDMNNLDTLLDQQVAYLILPKVDGIKKQVVELKKLGLLKS